MEAGGILSGVRVLDLATDVAGAFAAKLLATFGADVIKVEAPGGDPTRWLPPRTEGDSPDAGILFAALNAGKRSLIADPGYRGDIAMLATLLDRARIVIESGAPGEWLERGARPQRRTRLDHRLLDSPPSDRTGPERAGAPRP